MLEEESSKYMSLNIGNLTPRESINVNFKYSAPLESDEDKWKLVIPCEFIVCPLQTI